MTTTIKYQGRQTRRSGSEQRRLAILEAALRIIVREGVRAVRHRAVAKEAEVPLSATTYYFKDIGDLISDTFTLFAERAIREVVEPFQQQIFAILDGFSGELPQGEQREQLMETIAGLAAAFMMNEATTQRDHLIAEQAFMQEALLDPKLAELAQVYMRAQLEALTEAFRKLGTGAPELDAEFALAAMWALERQLLLGGIEGEQEVRRRARHMLNLLVGNAG